MTPSRAESRSTAPVITPISEYGRRLGAAWPEVGPKVEAVLRARGVARPNAEDALQETAARALRAQTRFGDESELFRWAVVVAWRIAIDGRRRDSRLDHIEAVDAPARDDVATLIEHRDAVRAVKCAFEHLPAPDRTAILDGLSAAGPTDRREAVRLAVRRHRGRARLATLVTGFLTWTFWAVYHLRAVRTRTGPLQLVALSAAVAVISVGGVALFGGSRPDPLGPVVPLPDPVPTTPAPVGAVPTVPLPPPPTDRGWLAPLAPPDVSPPTAARPPADPPAVKAGRVPSVQFEVPAAMGGSGGGVLTRPSAPGDHLMCVGPMVTGTQCIDYPAPVQAVYQPVLG